MLDEALRITDSHMCYPMQLRLSQAFSLTYKGYPFDTRMHDERQLLTTASFVTQ